VKKVKFEDIKAVTRSSLSKKDRQYNGQKTDNTMAKRQRKNTKGQTMIYRSLHRKQKIEQHESH